MAGKGKGKGLSGVDANYGQKAGIKSAAKLGGGKKLKGGGKKSSMGYA